MTYVQVGGVFNSSGPCPKTNKMSTKKLKELWVEYKDNAEMRIKIDQLLLDRIGEDDLIKFWDENK